MKKIVIILIGIFGLAMAQNVDPETFVEITTEGAASGKYVYTNTGGEGKISVDSVGRWFGTLWNTNNGHIEPNDNVPFRVDYDVYSHVNDTIPFVPGLFELPFSGSYQDAKDGKFINGLLDYSAVGGPEGAIMARIGYVWPPTPEDENYLMVDTIQFIGQIKERIQIGINAQPPFSVTESYKTSLTITEGVSARLMSSVSYNKQLKSNLYDGSDPTIRYGGYFASFDPNKNLDEFYLAVDSTHTEISANIGTDFTDYYTNTVKLDSNGIVLGVNNPSGVSTTIAVTAKLNENGFVLPPLSAEPVGENGAIYYNTTLNKARIYENGAWRDL